MQGVAGTWKDLTDNVNTMAFNVRLSYSRYILLAANSCVQLTQQVRTISSATVSTLDFLSVALGHNSIDLYRVRSLEET